MFFFEQLLLFFILSLQPFVFNMAEDSKVQSQNNEDECKENIVQRQPAIYITHGGGPLPYLQHISNNQKYRMNDQSFPISNLQNLGIYITKYKPKAICVVSAHWETSKPTVLYQKSPPLYYDYYGFPKEAYELSYNAQIDMALTDKVVELLQELGGYSKNDIILDKKRGFDHGVFIPLKIGYKEADIPLIQVSLSAVTGDKKDTAKRNLRLGAILGGLREEGVMIIGSGSSYHNMEGFTNPNSKESSRKFNNWLLDIVSDGNNIEDAIYWGERN